MLAGFSVMFSVQNFTLKVPSQIVAVDNPFFFFFPEKIRLDISYDLSACTINVTAGNQEILFILPYGCVLLACQVKIPTDNI